MSCAKGSIAWPAIAGKESLISSFWTLGVFGMSSKDSGITLKTENQQG